MLAAVCAVAICASAQVAAAASAPRAVIRVNQVGYRPGDAKRAVLLSTVSEAGARFAVVNGAGNTVLRGRVGRALPAWSGRYRYARTIDFSAARAAGADHIVVTGPARASSPRFRVAANAALYSVLLRNSVRFYQAQRDGPNVIGSVLDRKPSHANDATATIYGAPAYRYDSLTGDPKALGGTHNVSGGWFDAGDYIKLVQTTSYTEAILLTAVRRNPVKLSQPNRNLKAEARFGLDWLNKMWDDSTQTLYYQVGIGDGNGCGSICGDHDIWRLPQADDTYGGSDPRFKYIRTRPVFRSGAPGQLVSPNLAGRLAADFGLCYQVYRHSNPTFAANCLRSGEHVFALARTTDIRRLRTASPHDYYPETQWRDDLEYGATELALALQDGGLPSGLPHASPLFYIKRAAHWANRYLASSDQDSLNLYDVSGIAHGELANAIAAAGSPSGLETTRAALVANLRAKLETGTAHAASDPFGFGVQYGTWDETPHALGLAYEAGDYDRLTHSSRYQAFGRRQVDWVLGRNAWGSSFVVGAGRVFPNCMQNQIANLSGSLDGKPPLELGATVDGPNPADVFTDLGLPGGARSCPVGGGNRFRPFDARGARYMDDARAWPSVEPTLDYTALGVIIFANRALG